MHIDVYSERFLEEIAFYVKPLLRISSNRSLQKNGDTYNLQKKIVTNNYNFVENNHKKIHIAIRIIMRLRIKRNIRSKHT